MLPIASIAILACGICDRRKPRTAVTSSFTVSHLVYGTRQFKQRALQPRRVRLTGLSGMLRSDQDRARMYAWPRRPWENSTATRYWPTRSDTTCAATASRRCFPVPVTSAASSAPRRARRTYAFSGLLLGPCPTDCRADVGEDRRPVIVRILPTQRRTELRSVWPRRPRSLKIARGNHHGTRLGSPEPRQISRPTPGRFRAPSSAQTELSLALPTVCPAATGSPAARPTHWMSNLLSSWLGSRLPDKDVVDQLGQGDNNGVI